MVGTHKHLSVCIALALAVLTGCNGLTNSTDKCEDGLLLRSCGRATPNLPDCVRQVLEYDMRKLKDGSEQLGLDKIDPLYVKEMTIKLPPGRLLRLKNLQVKGLANLAVENMTLTAGKGVAGVVKYSIYIPLFEIKSKYKVINSKDTKIGGVCTITIRDYRTSFELDSLIQSEEDGEKYLYYTRSLSKFIGASAVEVHLSGFGKTTQLDAQSEEVRDALEDSIARKQAEINFAYTNRLYEFAPPLSKWLPANVTGPFEVCLRRRKRYGISCVDMYSRGF